MLRTPGARALARQGSRAGQRWLTTAGQRAIRVEQPTDFERAFDSTDRYAAVDGRGLIEVAGADAAEFLQGMHCNSMSRIEQHGAATAFLTPQGRVTADAFVYPSAAASQAPAFLVEVDARAREHLLRTLTFYKLRAKMAIRDVSDEYKVWSVWGPGATARLGGSAGHVWAQDGRAPGMGLRVVTARDALELPAGFEQRAASEYRLRRILKGVAEGADDFVQGVAVPLECNMDYMEGVDFEKGCYVGQELTIRTHHRGVVRKRLVPALFGRATPTYDGTRNPLQIDCAGAPEIGPQTDVERVDRGSSEARDQQQQQRARRRVVPGKMGSTACNAGLVLMRLEHVQEYVAQQTQAPETGAVVFQTASVGGEPAFVSPWLPSWWPPVIT